MLEEALGPKHQAVLREIRRAGPMTRAETVLRTGFSRSTVHVLTGDLLGAGLIHEVDRTGGRGRPASAFAYSGRHGHVLAIAFEQERLSAGVANLAGEILAEEAVAVDVAGDAERALGAAAQAATAVFNKAGVGGEPLAVVASLPGPVDNEHGTIGSYSILRGWAGVDARRRLGEMLGAPTTLDNDANLAAWAEAKLGSAVGCEHLLYVKASTGVGAGLVLDGRIYRGVAGMAGELGHVTVDPAGRICRCGSKGCLETVAGIDGITGALTDTHPGGVAIGELIELARRGDAAAERALADAGAALGRAIGEVANVLNPQQVVIGGELAAAGDLVIEPLRRALRQAAMQVIANTLEVRASQLGPRADLLGAAMLAAALVHGDEPSLSEARAARAA